MSGGSWVVEGYLSVRPAFALETHAYLLPKLRSLCEHTRPSDTDECCLPASGLSSDVATIQFSRLRRCTTPSRGVLPAVG